MLDIDVDCIRMSNDSCPDTFRSEVLIPPDLSVISHHLATGSFKSITDDDTIHITVEHISGRYSDKKSWALQKVVRRCHLWDLRPHNDVIHYFQCAHRKSRDHCTFPVPLFPVSAPLFSPAKQSTFMTVSTNIARATI
jgi:hypothetical protein